MVHQTVLVLVVPFHSNAKESLPPSGSSCEDCPKQLENYCRTLESDKLAAITGCYHFSSSQRLRVMMERVAYFHASFFSYCVCSGIGGVLQVLSHV